METGLPIHSARVKKILLVRLAKLGDVLFTTPLIRAIKKGFPKAKLTYITLPYAAPVLENNPYLDQIIIFQPGISRILAGQGKYDVAINLHGEGNRLAAKLVYCSGAPHRIGRNIRGLFRPYHNILWDYNLATDSMVRGYLNALIPLEIRDDQKKTEVFLRAEEKREAQHYLQDRMDRSQLLVGIHPGCDIPKNRWEDRKWAGLVDRLVAEHKANVLIFQGPDENKIASQIQRKTKGKSFLIPALDIRKYASIVSECNYFVALDSGPLHIAQALDIPTIALFLRSAPHMWFDYEKGAYIAKSRIGVKDVMAQLGAVMKGEGQRTEAKAIRPLFPGEGQRRRRRVTRQRPDRLKIKIADIILEIECRLPMEPIERDHRRRWKAFTYQGKRPADIILTVKAQGERMATGRSQMMFSNIEPSLQEANWTLSRKGNQYLVEKRLSRQKLYALFNARFTRGNIFFAGNPEVSTWKFEDISFDLLQIILIHYLAPRDGILVHSIGLEDMDQQGFIFVGPSGSGKSTTAHIWHRHSKAKILNDDRMVMRRIQGQFYLFATPWYGDAKISFASPNGGAKLSKIFFIHHHESHRLTALGPKDAYRHFYPNLFPTFGNREGLLQQGNFCRDVVQNIPCYQLGFKKDRSVVDFVRQVGSGDGRGKGI